VKTLDDMRVVFVEVTYSLNGQQIERRVEGTPEAIAVLMQNRQAVAEPSEPEALPPGVSLEEPSGGCTNYTTEEMLEDQRQHTLWVRDVWRPAHPACSPNRKTTTRGKGPLGQFLNMFEESGWPF